MSFWEYLLYADRSTLWYLAGSCCFVIGSLLKVMGGK